MDVDRRSDAGLEALDVPPANVVRVTGGIRFVGFDHVLAEEGASLEGQATAGAIGPLAQIETVVRCYWLIGATAFALVLAVAMGDEGPWFFVVTALTAIGGAWVDRRVEFSFAEGFIGYSGDVGWPRGVQEEDVRWAWSRSAPATG